MRVSGSAFLRLGQNNGVMAERSAAMTPFSVLCDRSDNLPIDNGKDQHRQDHHGVR
jgi:hypothetical protein